MKCEICNERESEHTVNGGCCKLYVCDKCFSELKSGKKLKDIYGFEWSYNGEHEYAE